MLHGPVNPITVLLKSNSQGGKGVKPDTRRSSRLPYTAGTSFVAAKFLWTFSESAGARASLAVCLFIGLPRPSRP